MFADKVIQTLTKNLPADKLQKIGLHLIKNKRVENLHPKKSIFRTPLNCVRNTSN
jgi:hypothetical protein